MTKVNSVINSQKSYDDKSSELIVENDKPAHKLKQSLLYETKPLPVANKQAKDKTSMGHTEGTKQRSKKTKSKRKKHSKNRQTREDVKTLGKSLSKLNLSSKVSSGSPSPPRRRVSPKRNISPSRPSVRSHAMGRRSSVSSLNSLEDVCEYIKSGGAKNIIVMAGAGISTASGIPDFRTPGTGLYDNLQKYNVPYPTAIFDLDYFNASPKPFFELAKELYPTGKYRPNITHHFVRMLHDKNLLLRMYTQNIDGLERLAGIPANKLVEAHGTFSSASCTQCGQGYKGDDVKKRIFAGRIPRCDSTPLCYGIVKPNIVFFGEDLPKRFYYYIKDFPQCDLLLVMGTSLEVEPFAGLVNSTRLDTPRVLLNRDRVGPFKKKIRSCDTALVGSLADTINALVDNLGWRDELDQLLEQDNLAYERLKLAEAENNSNNSDSGVSSASSNGRKSPNSLAQLSSMAAVDGKLSNTSVRSSKSLAAIPAPDVKRYFHTLRSTPLPKQPLRKQLRSPPKETRSACSSPMKPPLPNRQAALTTSPPSDTDDVQQQPKSFTNAVSYYDYIKQSAPTHTKQRSSSTNRNFRYGNLSSNPLVCPSPSSAVPTIHYTQTVSPINKKTSHHRKGNNWCLSSDSDSDDPNNF